LEDTLKTQKLGEGLLKRIPASSGRAMGGLCVHNDDTELMQTNPASRGL
jgi:hypothetical protein